jgi:hypothetical protein
MCEEHIETLERMLGAKHHHKVGDFECDAITAAIALMRSAEPRDGSEAVEREHCARVANQFGGHAARAEGWYADATLLVICATTLISVWAIACVVLE